LLSIAQGFGFLLQALVQPFFTGRLDMHDVSCLLKLNRKHHSHELLAGLQRPAKCR